MKVTLSPSRLNGTVSAPPSKSCMHRALICAAAADRPTKIITDSYSEDTKATIVCLKSLGAKIEYTEDGVTVYPIQKQEGECVLNCRESGSTLRFMLPFSAALGSNCTFIGAERLGQRPLLPLCEVLNKNGVSTVYGESFLPCKIEGQLSGNVFEIPGNISSQFISGLLFCLPILKNDSYIYITEPIESRPYIDMTIDALSKFGVEVIWKNDDTLFIKGNQTYKPKNISVEGDYSNAAFLDAFNYIGGNVKVLGLDENSLQGDKIYKKLFKDLKEGRPTIDISDCPDLAPILITLAAMLNGAEFTGTKRLEIKESNRGKVIADELSKFGAHIEVFDDKIIVAKSKLHTPKNLLYGHNDHRIVMSLSVISSYFGGKISGYLAVKKSYPDFLERINELNVNTKYGD